MGKALGELSAAKHNVKVMADATKGRPEIEWEVVHAYMANMGFFVLELNISSPTATDSVRFHQESCAIQGDEAESREMGLLTEAWFRAVRMLPMSRL
jgi:hypothetical protein